jgi:hypothetical protein
MTGLWDPTGTTAPRLGGPRLASLARARSCLGGLLSGLERKTGWSLAEHAGEAALESRGRLGLSRGVSVIVR